MTNLAAITLFRALPWAAERRVVDAAPVTSRTNRRRALGRPFPRSASGNPAEIAAPAFWWGVPRPPTVRAGRPWAWSPPVQGSRYLRAAPPSFYPFVMGSGVGGSGTALGLGIVAAPMIRGAAGMLSSFAVNYMVASLNPTTLSNFFGLMSQPHPMSFRGIGSVGFAGLPQPAFPFAKLQQHNPMLRFPFTAPRQRDRLSGFPFWAPPARSAPSTWPFMVFVRPRQQPAPAPAPKFPFNPFGLAGK